MKLAVLSDIHGNIRALNAVIRDLEHRGIEQVVNLGDCIYGPFDPRPVAECLIARQWPTVAGNEDRILGEGLEDLLLSRTAGWTRSQLSLKQMTWISDLPYLLALTEDVVCFHGQPMCDTNYLLTHVDEGGVVGQRPDSRDRAGVSRARSLSLPVRTRSHTAYCQSGRWQDDRESGQRRLSGLQG